MFTTAVIAFREFLEAFLIVGVFFAISKELNLRRQKEIITAAAIGIILSFILSFTVYALGDRARLFFNEENTELFEGLLLILSSVFIAYVIFSLHSYIQKKRDEMVEKAKSRMKRDIFDVSLFLTIVFLVLREGFEIALFTAGVSLFSAYIQNVSGLLVGFILSAVMGIIAVKAYGLFPLRKIFRLTEYLIVLMGAALLQHGVSILAEIYFHLDLSRWGRLGLSFLPDDDSFIGHLLEGFFGIDRDLSAARLIIMAIYITAVYLIFFRNRKVDPASLV